MKKNILLGILVFVALFTITGCVKNESNKENIESSKNTSNQIVGEYELQEVIDDTGTITAKEWKESRGSDEYMTINNDNTLTKISSYGKHGDMKHEYTYDDKYFYDKGKTAYSYEYIDGTIRLTDLEYDNIERVEIYKKK